MGQDDQDYADETSIDAPSPDDTTPDPLDTTCLFGYYWDTLLGDCLSYQLYFGQLVNLLKVQLKAKTEGESKVVFSWSVASASTKAIELQLDF